MTELDLLPEEWDVVRLGDVAEQRKETTNPGDGDWKYVGLEHIDPGESHLKRCGFSSEVRSSKLKFYSGDILYGKLRPYLDKGVLVDFEGICSTDIIVIKAKENLNETLLSYLVHIKDFRAYATKTMTGVNHPRTSWRTLSQFSISLPPLPEQHKIATVLSTVQQAKEKTNAVISATKELKKSLMKHLFTYGPVPVNEFNELRVDELQNAQNSKNAINLKETEIGLVPEEWDVVKLGDVAEQRKETTNPGDGDWKYVGLEHIDPGESHLKRYGFSNEVRSSKSKFYSGDILYGKLRPYLDKGVLVDFEGICSTDIIVIKTKENLNETLLSYLVHIKDFREYATKTMTGVNHPRTSWRTLSQFSIPLPPLPTQQKIASILSTVDKKIEAEEAKRKSLDELFKSLLQNLMTGKLRVNELQSNRVVELRSLKS